MPQYVIGSEYTITDFDGLSELTCPFLDSKYFLNHDKSILLVRCIFNRYLLVDILYR